MEHKIEFTDKKNIKYDLVFIVTYIDDKHILQMLSSVIQNNQHLNVLIILINQTGLSCKTKINNSRINIIEITSTKVSLSKARNIGITYLVESNIVFSHIMFPDDDSTFSDQFFSKYKKQINHNTNYLVDVYCEGTNRLFKTNKYNNGVVLRRHNYYAAMSVNMIVNYETFITVGLFDERMGIGTQYGAGEDIDYYIRACGIASSGFIYNKLIFNFHPSNASKFQNMNLYQTTIKLVKYGNGMIFMLSKHKMYFKALKTCFRAIGGVVLSLFKLDFKLFCAYEVVFVSRLAMLIKCIIFSKKYFIKF